MSQLEEWTEIQTNASDVSSPLETKREPPFGSATSSPRAPHHPGAPGAEPIGVLCSTTTELVDACMKNPTVADTIRSFTAPESGASRLPVAPISGTDLGQHGLHNILEQLTDKAWRRDTSNNRRSPTRSVIRQDGYGQTMTGDRIDTCDQLMREYAAGRQPACQVARQIDWLTSGYTCVEASDVKDGVEWKRKLQRVDPIGQLPHYALGLNRVSRWLTRLLRIHTDTLDYTVLACDLEWVVRRACQLDPCRRTFHMDILVCVLKEFVMHSMDKTIRIVFLPAHRADPLAAWMTFVDKVAAHRADVWLHSPDMSKCMGCHRPVREKFHMQNGDVCSAECHQLVAEWPVTRTNQNRCIHCGAICSSTTAMANMWRLEHDANQCFCSHACAKESGWDHVKPVEDDVLGQTTATWRFSNVVCLVLMAIALIVIAVGGVYATQKAIRPVAPLVPVVQTPPPTCTPIAYTTIVPNDTACYDACGKTFGNSTLQWYASVRFLSPRDLRKLVCDTRCNSNTTHADMVQAWANELSRLQPLTYFTQWYDAFGKWTWGWIEALRLGGTDFLVCLTDMQRCPHVKPL